MQISNVQNQNFKGLSIDKTFYNAASKLNQCEGTSKDFQKILSQLKEVSKGKFIRLTQGGGIEDSFIKSSTPVSSIGVKVVECEDEYGYKTIRTIASGYTNPIETLYRAFIDLTKEKTAKEAIKKANNKPIIKRERFRGTGNNLILDKFL